MLRVQQGQTIAGIPMNCALLLSVGLLSILALLALAPPNSYEQLGRLNRCGFLCIFRLRTRHRSIQRRTDIHTFPAHLGGYLCISRANFCF